MDIKYARTGPFKLEAVLENNPKYLILQFNDINPSTGNKSLRKMSKGGNWPSHLSEIILEKAKKLVGENVYVITSQTTKNWSTHDWFSDIETTRDFSVKGAFSNIIAADGASLLKDNLAIDGLSIVDCSLGKNCFEDENEYYVFYQTLQKRFNASISNKMQRFIDEKIARVRLPDKKRDTGAQGGFRATFWHALSKDECNFDYYILLKVDRKTLEKKFPEKDEMLNLISDINQRYKDKSLDKLVIAALSEEQGSEEKPKPKQELEPTKRTYLNCPFSEKDECKSLGGKWDAKLKKWYVPDGMPLEKFQKWLTSNPGQTNVEAGFLRHLDIPYEGLTEDEKDIW